MIENIVDYVIENGWFLGYWFWMAMCVWMSFILVKSRKNQERLLDLFLDHPEKMSTQKNDQKTKI